MQAGLGADVLMLVMGFTLAGVIASGYRLIAGRTLVCDTDRHSALAAIAVSPLLVLGAPALIMSRAVRHPPAQYRFVSTMASTVLAGLWSLACGMAVMRSFAVIAAAIS